MSEDEQYLGSRFREWRHNPCLMQPTSVLMIILSGVFMFITLLLQIPTFLLGFLLSPILSRSYWYVEFLYPWDIARWAHFFLMRSTTKKFKESDKNRGFHSRTMEQRIQVIPDRVYIHPIPQFMDNLGWLIVCVPPAEVHANTRITVEDQRESIVAVLIDCGEFAATIRAIEIIQKLHYGKRPIHVQTILSTHKHHDHTGGNKEFMAHVMGEHLYAVCGGAVERVPGCNHLLVNGDRVPLPKSGSNNMNELVDIEAIAVPGHTRGSLVYRLSAKPKSCAGSEYMFTGDTMFSAGGGVPFESDVGIETDAQLAKSHGNTFIRAGIGKSAMERCFAEILLRGLPNDGPSANLSNVLVFPGHEYTHELLSRQLQNNPSESYTWKNFAPNDFFETVSHWYVAMHRRTLPHNSGKLLVLPTTLRRETVINPHFRSLRRAGEMAIRAVLFWYNNFGPKEDSSVPTSSNGTASRAVVSTNPASNVNKWTLDPTSADQDVFTTVYSSDLDALIESLSSGRISAQAAAQKLRDAKTRLTKPVVNKRAIPGFLPSDKGIYRGIAALVMLGSPPSAMTNLDSRRMNLPPPVDANSDHIKISLRRLKTILARLGLLESEPNVAKTIDVLWGQASQYNEDGLDTSEAPIDEIRLGVLKWVIFGVPANQPSFFSKLCCMPCSNVPVMPVFPAEHPALSMNQKSGDLVSHDILGCLLCKSATGCMDPRHKSRPEPLRRETVSGDDLDGGDEGLEMVEGITSTLLAGSY
eukprot:Nitzschia sp. Nitz4//scaffold12_size214221//85538//87796//NITZ4_001499-RA/size214221-processed-gene-0.115-mRNA-1//1//CDS//3329535017//2257//frame0